MTLTTPARPRAVVVAIGDEIPRDMWGRMHAADPDAVPTQSTAWSQALRTATGHRDASRLYELSDGRLALLPLVRRSLFTGGGAVLHSPPVNWGFGGLIAPDGIDAALVTAVVDDLVALRAVRLHVRPNPLHAAYWRTATAGRTGVTAVPARAHVLDLDGGFEQVFATRFKSAARTRSRRAERDGVVIETGHSPALVAEFHRLLTTSFRRWAEQQHEPGWLAAARGRARDPRAKFEAIAAALGDELQVRVARIDGRPAAATLVLRGGNNAHYTRGAIDPDVLGGSPATVLLQRAAIADACAAECRSMHLGETGWNAGLAQFKEQFGARPYEYEEYWIERLPLRPAGTAVKSAVKNAIGFRDV